MEQVAKAGILTGISMMSIPGAQRSGMPILPGLADTDENLEATIRCTANHGGRFAIAGGLTLADQQREYFLSVLRDRFPDLLPLYERMYPHRRPAMAVLRAATLMPWAGASGSCAGSTVSLTACPDRSSPATSGR
jgi:DNA repair photolyase